MSGVMIAQLLIQFGPAAFQLIEQLIGIWNKPALTTEEVLAFTAKAKQSYEDYISAARAAAQAPVTPSSPS